MIKLYRKLIDAKDKRKYIKTGAITFRRWRYITFKVEEEV